ncbi:MAG: LytR C-terminal domain-containing protein [Actinomycetota bacterium]|nr:LytR C-terminal domain-containing protein [Actinomycetota bacterium]
MNVGFARILVIASLIVGGILLLASGFPGAGGVFETGDSGTSPTPQQTTSPSPTRHPSRSPTPAPQQTGVKIAVFNGTSAVGLAAQAQNTLEQDGYVPAQDPADSPITPLSQTVIYYRGGTSGPQNRANAQYVVDTYFPGASVKELGSDFTSLAEGADLVIALGNDYAQRAGA